MNSTSVRRTLLGLGAAAVAAMVPSQAQAGFVFEYNYPDLDWYTIETEHFFVHYPVSKNQEGNDHYLDSTASARRSAKVSEEMWEPVCANFDFYLNEKVHIVLVNQTDYLEGFTVPPWDWIVISANPGSYFYRMRGRMEWFGDVIVHEFGHVVSLKQDAFMAEGTQGVLISTLYQDGLRDQNTGAEFFVAGSEPFWWTEGVTEYSSDEAGYNWWSNSRDQNIRMTFLEDRVLSYDELLIAFDKDDFGDGERNYQQGYSLNAYIRQRFGDEVTFRMAKAGGERWRPNWQTLVEELTGVTMRQIYDDWRAYNEARYQAMWDEVKAEGEVVGRELISSPGGWEYTDPDGRDKWMDKELRFRESERERGGTWDVFPRMSEDGRWYAENARGRVVLSQRPEHLIPTLADESAGAEAALDKQLMSDMSMSVVNEFNHNWDFIPGEDALVITGNEHHMKNPWIPGGHVELDGYEWKAIYTVSLEPRKEERKHRGEKVEYDTLEPKKVLGVRKDSWRYEMVPNTLRGHDPAMSPDGQTIAYIQYEDGGDQLALINRDGTNKRILTDFQHGFVQSIDWSPDGSQMVISLFKDQRQDLFIVNADGSGLQAINRDPWEDQDPHWAKDGSIWFSSDPTGIFNIYRYDPQANTVTQVTNTIASAQMPSLTPQGDLLYVNLMAHGWKAHAVSRDEFLEEDASYRFGLDPDQEEVMAYLDFKEDLSQYADLTTPYKSRKALMAPTAVPMINIENDSMTNWGLSPGFQVFSQDFVGDHTAFLVGRAGEDPLLLAWYTYTGWYPAIDLMFYHYQGKSDYGYLLDEDDNLETTDDQEIYEIKQHFFQNNAMLRFSYPVNARLDVGMSARAFQYGFKGTTDVKFAPYLFAMEGGIDFVYNSIYARYGHLNPRGGRRFEGSWNHGYTDVVYQANNGYDTDDGELLDNYNYNRFQLNWTEHIPLRGFGIDALSFMGKRQHTLEWTFQAGYIDRNVMYLDEFRGGGTHPAYMGTGAIQPNNQFSGYPAFSLAGETMLVAAAGYRFPVIRDIDRRTGPFYWYDVHMQVGGTAGNLWSYKPPSEDQVGEYYHDSWGERVAYDPASIKREIPFIDKAYKNGNYMLFDAMAEVRLSASLMTMSWNSFFRVAYGFNEITGIFDPNGDDISETTRTGTGNSLSAETEKPGPRFYIGIGTGW